ncbi:MAG: hypothetical protein V1921_06235 [Candidatus Altiarchaeota archaeon]
MTGTKIVKLKLEGGGDEKLPKLMVEPAIEKALKLCNSQELGVYYKFRQSVIEGSRGFDFDSKQVQKLIYALEAQHGDDKDYTQKAGVFLSAIMQGSTVKEFNITVVKPLDWLCYMLEGGKNVTINGTVGANLGDQMKDGKITVNGDAGMSVGNEAFGGRIIVNGNAGEFVGNGMAGGNVLVKGNAAGRAGYKMEAGDITIAGSCGDGLGQWMLAGNIHVKKNAGNDTGLGIKGGKLKVDGDVGENTGWNMEKGIIELGGDYKSLSEDIQGGRILHKGKQIWPVETTR